EGESMRMRQIAPGLPEDVADAEALRLIPQERRRVLALERPVGLAPRRLQRLVGHDLDVVSVGPARRMQISQKILAVVRAEDAADRARVDQRTVRRDLDDEIVLAGVAGGAEVAIEQIGRVPRVGAHARAAAEPEDRLVGDVGGGGDDELEDRGRGEDALELTLEDGLAGERQEHLAGEPRGAGPGLDDDEGHAASRAARAGIVETP